MCFQKGFFYIMKVVWHTFSAVFSGGAGGARAPPEFGGSQKGRSLISAYQSLAITTNTPGFEKLNTALMAVKIPCRTFILFQQMFKEVIQGEVFVSISVTSSAGGGE